MPLSDTPGPNMRKKPSKLITDFSSITQDDLGDTQTEVAELDLGKKIKAPKEVMLEELSLLNNKGSRMFKMRHQRVERFIYENNPELHNQQAPNFENVMPTLVGEIPSDCHQTDVKMDQQVPGTEASQDAGESSPQEKKCKYVKTYVSPWERAMKGDKELLATMRVAMPGPHVHCEPPPFKSFNRTPLPFGGLEKALLMMFQPPEIVMAPEDLEPSAQLRDVRLRPSFNRTPIGWAGRTEPSRMHVELDTVPFDVETDEL